MFIVRMVMIGLVVPITGVLFTGLIMKVVPKIMTV